MTSRVPAIATKLILTACITTLAACATSNQPPEAYLRLYGTAPLSAQRFAICNLAGCEETTNTTSYLVLLQERGLMQWHAPRYPQHRGFMHGRWPHNTAVMEDLQTGERYAVDSYFHANGIAPEIVPVPEWIAGFTPAVMHNSP